jgi:hypothetical protein
MNFFICEPRQSLRRPAEASGIKKNRREPKHAMLATSVAVVRKCSKQSPGPRRDVQRKRKMTLTTHEPIIATNTMTASCGATGCPAPSREIHPETCGDADQGAVEHANSAKAPMTPERCGLEFTERQTHNATASACGRVTD